LNVAALYSIEVWDLWWLVLC